MITARPIDAQLSRELRRQVLRPALAPGDPLPGDDESGVVHIGAFDGPELLSACLIFPAVCPWLPDRPAWRLRAMASEPAAQGRGAGTAVLDEAARIAAGHGARILWCEARETAESFYARNGWHPHGELYLAIGRPHRQMWRELGSSQAP